MTTWRILKLTFSTKIYKLQMEWQGRHKEESGHIIMNRYFGLMTGLKLMDLYSVEISNLMLIRLLILNYVNMQRLLQRSVKELEIMLWQSRSQIMSSHWKLAHLTSKSWLGGCIKDILRLRRKKANIWFLIRFLHQVEGKAGDVQYLLSLTS